jgi:glycosyltransferase involved in cell wall biosynthesis
VLVARSAGRTPLTAATATERARPIRLLTLTTLFPNSRQPRHGVFVANRLARMRDTGRVDATVVAAVPWFPGVYRDANRVPREETILGIPVRHPRYVHVPRVGMRLQPGSLARALLDELRHGRLDTSRFDVVDAHYFYPDGVAAARVAQVLRLPLVISARGSDINLIGDIAFARERMLRAANQAQALIAVSGALARSMRALGMPGEPIHVLRNGVDVEMFAPVDRADARRRLGIAREGRWVLGAGNQVPEKAFDVLIHAIAMIAGARLLLVGEGPERHALASLAARVAPGRVEFRDNMPQAELRYAYSACDVLGLPSLREGWPNVVLEAIACGTPVVAARVGGIPEILHDDAPARIVNERTPEAWAAALSAILDLRRDIETVRRYAFRFGWDEVVRAQCALYEAVAAAGRQRDRARRA